MPHELPLGSGFFPDQFIVGLEIEDFVVQTLERQPLDRPFLIFNEQFTGDNIDHNRDGLAPQLVLDIIAVIVNFDGAIARDPTVIAPPLQRDQPMIGVDVAGQRWASR